MLWKSLEDTTSWLQPDLCAIQGLVLALTFEV